jgi:tetratricopeptide (TPR) repeat protein
MLDSADSFLYNEYVQSIITFTREIPMICPNCKSEVSNTASTCPNCGAFFQNAQEFESQFRLDQQVNKIESGGKAIGYEIGEYHYHAGLKFDPFSEDLITPPPPPSPIPEFPFFFGRNTEVERLDQLLDEHHFVAISGMPGIGKTALAAHLAHQRAAASKVYWYSFTLADSVDSLLFNFAGFFAWQGKPGLWNLMQRLRLMGGEIPTIEEIFGYWVKLTEGENCLLCLDAIHHAVADPRLEKLLNKLKEAANNIRLSLLLTSNCHLDCIPASQEIILSGLSLADSRKILAPIDAFIPAEALQTLHAKTSGNPQFLLMAKDTLLQGYKPDELIQGLVTTSSVERFLIERIEETLDDGEKGVMQGLAVLSGYPSRREALEAILEDYDFRAALWRLVSRYLVTVHREWEFNLSELIREFFYQSIPPQKRTALHRKAAAYFESQEGGIPLAAFHHQNAGEPVRAAQLVVFDTRALLNRGHVFMLQKVLGRFREGELDPELWALANLAKGQVETFLRESQPARESLQLAHNLLDGLPESVDKWNYLARACQAMGELLERESSLEAMAWYRRGLEYLPDEKSSRAAALYIKMGNILNQLGELDQAIEQAQTGLNLLAQGDSQIRVSGLITIGACKDMQGKYVEALTNYQEALTICERIHDDFQKIKILGNIAIVNEINGDWPGAAEKYKNSLGLAERLGAVAEQAKLNNNLGILCTKMGDHQAAEQYLTNAMILVHTYQMPLYEAFVLTSLIDLSIRKEQWLIVEEVLGQAEVLIQDKEISYLLPYQFYYQAQLRLGLGDPAGAERAANQAIDQARTMELSFEEGLGLRALGMVWQASGRSDEAFKAFEQGCKLLEDDRYELARTQAIWGAGLLKTPEKGRGITLLREAQTAFHQLGAQRDLEGIEERINDSVNV